MYRILGGCKRQASLAKRNPVQTGHTTYYYYYDDDDDDDYYHYYY